MNREEQKQYWKHYPKKRRHSGSEIEVTIRPEWNKARVYSELSKLSRLSDYAFDAAVYSYWEWSNTGEGAGPEEDGWQEVPGGLYVNCDENTGICRVRAERCYKPYFGVGY